MDIKVVTKKVLSSDGIHQLSGKVYIPDCEPKGLFHVVHGMCEYLGRYDAFMRDLASDGYIVFGYDHLGHGETAVDDSELGFIAHKDGYQRLIDDVKVFGAEVKKEYGDTKPFILMGHSMGSFIVRLAAAQYNMYDKLIIMGSGGPNPAAGAGIAVTALVKMFKGEKHISRLVYALAFGSYNKRFASENDSVSWLSKDVSLRKRYKADKFCNYSFTASAMQDLIRLNSYSNKSAFFKGLDKQKPILIVSGADDPVGNYGKGVQTVYDKLKAQGADVKIKIYDDCRHEILNDTCREEVIADIKEFVNA